MIMTPWSRQELGDLLSLASLRPDYITINNRMVARGWPSRTTRAIETRLLQLLRAGGKQLKPVAYTQRVSWSAEEDALLEKGMDSGKHHDEIGSELAALGYKRTASSVRHRALVLKRRALKIEPTTQPSLISLIEPKHTPAPAVSQPVHIPFSAQVFGIYLRHGRKIVLTVSERWEGRVLRDFAITHPDLLTVRLPEDPLSQDWVLQASLSKVFIEAADTLVEYLLQLKHPLSLVDHKQTY